MDKAGNKISRKTAILAAVAVSGIVVGGVITYLVGIVYDTMPLPFDLAVQNFFFSLRSSLLNPIIIVLTHTTDTITIIVLCIILLAMPNRKTYGVPVSLTAIAGVAVYKPMKHMFLRERPDISLHLVEQGGYSFPSGHSVTSIVVYGLLIYLINRHCPDGKLKKALVAVCAVLFVFVGPSRIYVGVHWPTDVLAGWCIGAAVLAVSIIILEKKGIKNENI